MSAIDPSTPGGAAAQAAAELEATAPRPAPEPARGARALAYLVSAVALGAVLYPLTLDQQDASQDSFPISTYPMFSRGKARTASVTSAVALVAGGGERPIPPRFVATSETMQAERTIGKSVRAGRAEARKLCTAIAERLADSDAPEFAAAEHVALVTLTVDSIDYLRGETRPLARREHVRCKVGRPR